MSLSIVLRVPRPRCLLLGYDTIGCHLRPILSLEFPPLDPEVIEEVFGDMLDTLSLEGAA